MYPGKTLHSRCIACEDKLIEHEERGVVECSSCKEVKPREDFNQRKLELKTGRTCKSCINDYAEKKRSDVDAVRKRRNSHYLKYYGISLDQYEEILAKQNHCCAICERPQSAFKKNFAVDHAHGGPDAGRVRGLLCDLCNRFVVWKHNTSVLLKKAAEYIDTGGHPYTVPPEFLKGRPKKRKRRVKK